MGQHKRRATWHNGEVVWKAEVRALFCICAVHADSSQFQLAVLCRVVSTCRSHHSLRRPSGIYSHPSRLHRHRSGAPGRTQHLPVRLARLTGLLALYLDVVRSFRRRARSPQSWDVSRRIRRPREPLRGPVRPRRLPTPLSPPSDLLVANLDVVRPFHRRARF